MQTNILENSPMDNIMTRKALIAVMCGIAMIAFVICGKATAQFPLPHSVQSPNVLSPSASNDPDAVAAFNSVIDRLGGREAWTNIRSAETHAIASNPDGQNSHAFYMLDDWSTESTRFRRRSPTFTGLPINHNGQAFRVIHTQNTNKVLPEFDQARVLLGHLPGASIEIMLRKPEYIFKNGSNWRCRQTEQCVDIYRKGYDGTTIKEQEWTISKVTHLPVRVRYNGQSFVNSSSQIWQEIDYTSFHVTGGVVVPNEIELGSPNGSREKLLCKVPVFNQPFDTQKFDAEPLQ